MQSVGRVDALARLAHVALDCFLRPARGRRDKLLQLAIGNLLNALYLGFGEGVLHLEVFSRSWRFSYAITSAVGYRTFLPILTKLGPLPCTRQLARVPLTVRSRSAVSFGVKCTVSTPVNVLATCVSRRCKCPSCPAGD